MPQALQLVDRWCAEQHRLAVKKTEAAWEKDHDSWALFVRVWYPLRRRGWQPCVSYLLALRRSITELKVEESIREEEEKRRTLAVLRCCLSPSQCSKHARG